MACHALVVVASMLVASWEIVGGQQTVKLKTRDSDGAALCAQEDQDTPSRYASMSEQMPNAPDVVGCSMTCTTDYLCQHFNYVPSDPEYPCHLYYYPPTHFDVEPNCMYYETPGKTWCNPYRFVKVVVRYYEQNWRQAKCLVRPELRRKKRKKEKKKKKKNKKKKEEKEEEKRKQKTITIKIII